MAELDNLHDADGKNKISKTKDNTIEDFKHTEKTATSSNTLFVATTMAESPKTDSNLDATDITKTNGDKIVDENNNNDHSTNVKAYDAMSLEALAIELEKLIRNEKVQAIRTPVESIKSEFNSKLNTLIKEKKEAFINDGGNEIDFYYTTPIQKRFKIAYKDYRNKLNLHYKSIEQNLKLNLQQKLDIIEELKSLVNVEENINSTYKQFKELQERWRNTGPIPKDKYNNAWNSYHHHTEVFYDFLHLNRDLRDLDFKHNLEKKIKIIERAEALAKNTDTLRAFGELQQLHKMWKEELGPVALKYREPIWQRFKAATKIINDKKHLYYKEIDKVYEQNLEKKNIIISKINAITHSMDNSHNSWQKNIKEIETLREAFFNAGKVPINANEKTWAIFKEAIRQFNKKKNLFYRDLKKVQYNNLEQKRELIKIAEDNKGSNDFEITTPLMKKIQNDWKKIGHVPRKDSDKIWKQFKNACNFYFERIQSKRNEANKELLNAYLAKKELLDLISDTIATDDKEIDIALIRDYANTWKDLGKVPSDKRYVDSKFNKLLDSIFAKLHVTKNEAEMIKFEIKLEGLNNSDDNRALINEQVFIRKKIDEVKSNINQLENNLQFFTNVKDSNPLVKTVKTNIINHKKDLELWVSKLAKVKQMT